MAFKIWLVLLLPLVASGVVVEADSDCQFEESDSSLNCRLRTLQSGPPSGSNALIARANKLKLECWEQDLTESQLRPQHFGSLPFLQELHLDSCQIRTLPARAFFGLANLRKLTVSRGSGADAGNAGWQMEMSSDSLAGLGGGLKSLDLSANSLWLLPAGLLCEMPHLKSLNLSANHLLEAADAGLAVVDGCGPANLASLDLSFNLIGSLRRGDLRLASEALTSLNLAHNRLSLLGEDALGGNLRNLQELNLGSNLLSALPPTGLFNGSEALKELDLSNNSLTLLPSGVFRGLSGLAKLNLSRNAISSHLLTTDTFLGLEALQVLDLSYNRITKVEAATFRHMKSLQVLRLQHNLVRTISEKAFGSQTQLRILSLSFNSVEHLAEDAFSGLSKLESLSLDNNRIASVHMLPQDAKQLKDLALNGNVLSEIPYFISGASSLIKLDLGHNLISNVTGDQLANLHNLYGLRLAANKLTSIANDTFAGASNVHILNLAHNEISSIEQGAFHQLTKLRALRLDGNQLADINGLVSSLGQLQWLNVSSNSLQWFDYAFVPSSLEWLDVSYNLISELGNFYNLDNFALRVLKASGNGLERLGPQSFPSGSPLEDVWLEHNALKYVEPFTFRGLGSLARVDLSSNSIETLLPDALTTGSHKGRPGFSLIGNPLKCDCQTAWIPGANGASFSSSSGIIVDLESLECSLHDGERVQFLEAREEDFLCTYNAHCSAQCMCCDFFACDCRFQCPDGCDCLHDATWSHNIVTCSAKGHHHVPLLLPLDATEVRLDGNALGHLETQSFLGRANLRRLFVNASQIISIGNNTFSGLDGLQELHLEDNSITELRGNEFNALPRLKELYLHNNDLTYINEVTFSVLRSLRILTLHGNLLTVFPVWRLLDNPVVHSLTLSQNTWSCECEFIRPFNDFLEKRALSIADYDAVQCVSDNVIDTFDIACSESSSAVVTKHDIHQGYDLVSLLVPLILATVVLITGFLAVFVFRRSIKNWLYSKSSEVYESSRGGSVVGSSSASASTYAKSKLFDVYISYAGKDAEFVDQTLAPTLENGSTSYKLCLHQRDFPPSASLYDTVSVATESSSRVIVVLSRAYLHTEWPHVKAPLRNCLSDNSKLIILLVEDLSEEDLIPHPDLLQHLQTCPTVRWGSTGFLNKLRFFLPESAFLTFQRSINLRLQQRQSLTPLPAPPSSSSRGLESLQYHYVTSRSDHTYHSIPDNHIYHTLEPNTFLNRSKLLQVPNFSPKNDDFHHSHSASTSSGTQLLPAGNNNSKKVAGRSGEEYIV